MELLFLDADDLRRALPMPAAIETARAAFRAQGAGELVAPARLSLAVEPAGGTTLVMPAHLPGTGLAVKVVSVFPGNAARGRATSSGLVVVLDEESGEPAALLDGTFLTAWRTGAACGAAVDALAAPDVEQAAVLGCGPVGRAQVEALAAVRSLRRLRLWSRDPTKARRSAEELAGSLGAELVPAATPAEAVADAGVVALATPATEPLFPASALAPGAHLCAAGSFTHAMCEFDPALVRGARVYVDERAAAEAEAGELHRAREAGWTQPADWIELGEVLRGEAGERPAGRSLFKSVGLAVQDVTAAAAAVAAAREAGIGRVLATGT